MKASHSLPAIVLGCISAGIAIPSLATSPLVFLESGASKNDLTGILSGKVKFAQTHTIDPTDNAQLEQPRLVSLRETLVMFIPADPVVRIHVRAVSATGQFLGKIYLDAPADLPKADNPGSTALGPDVIYSDKAWSARLPSSWIQPGLQLTFFDYDDKRDKIKSGVLPKVDIGAVNQVMLNNIRIGVLTPPGSLSGNKFESNTAELANDYFQKIPVSQLIVGNYSPVQLGHVVMPDGRIYTTQSTGTGGTYEGDLREVIIKDLISRGIDHANFGVNASASASSSQPEFFHQVTVHQSWGKYANGVVRHGYSGGNGVATLNSTSGNEFSHELGHGYGLEHYPGGAAWYVFSPGKPWGWDSRTNRFIANFFWTRDGAVSDESHPTSGFSMPPYKGIYRFNRDAMGGGSPGSTLTQFTLHTAYSAKRIQQHLESESVISERSPTGYLKWDELTSRMNVDTSENKRKPEKFGVPVTTLVGFYDPLKLLPTYVYPALHGSYGFTYPEQSVAPGQCWLEVSYLNGATEKFPLPGERLNNYVMNRFHVNVAESSKPVSAGVHCPTKNILDLFEDWKLAYFKVSSFKEWSSADKTPQVGDIYYYPSRGYYFRLKTKSYWYFPTQPVDNKDWEFVGDNNALRQQFEASLQQVNMGDQLLHEISIKPATEQPEPAVVVGRATLQDKVSDAGTAGQALTFGQWKLNKLKTTTISKWDGTSHTGTPGQIFLYEKYGYYFRLRTSNYWYFPTKPVNNAYWEYVTDEVTLKKEYDALQSKNKRL